ncbi:MAG: hypothetical protein DHS20C20_30100 [Ardenticatenaceae bacterium]|nr:MAG: hypothetical protein DHS20C20_30100 [Ardenticatenaceae bacterium]
MNNSTEPINLLLSREELLLTLRLLQADSIPGLDNDPQGNLTPEGMELALAVAGRGLQARELAQVGEDGSLALHHLLMTAVGICAYATQTIFVYHWREDGELPTRYFGHIRGDDFVAHTRPNSVLHRFTLLPTKEKMVEQIFQLCAWEDKEADKDAYSLEVPDFGQVRQWARGGELDTAVTHLVNHRASPEAATALVSTLSQSPHVSILQTLRQRADQSVTKQDFTLVQDQDHGWLMTSPTGDANGPLRVETAVKADIIPLISE